MIPRMTIRQRIIAWLLWRFERFDSMGDAESSILIHPELLRCVSLLSDCWYIKNAKEDDDDELDKRHFWRATRKPRIHRLWRLSAMRR